MRTLMGLWFALYIIAFQLGGTASVYAQSTSSSTSISTSPSTTSSEPTGQPPPSSSPVAEVSVTTVTLISTLISVQTITTGTTVQGDSSSSTPRRSTVYQTQTVPLLSQPAYSSGIARSKADGTTVSLALLVVFAAFSLAL